MNVMVEHIPPDKVGEIWDAIELWVQSALGKDRSYTSFDIKTACENGSLELRLIYAEDELKGFFTSVIIPAPRGKTCYAPWLGGKDLGKWVEPAFHEFKDYLRTQGVISFSWIGRLAWKRFLGADYEGVFYLMNL